MCVVDKGLQPKAFFFFPSFYKIQMQQRDMGRLDWKVSALGFGAMRLPRNIKKAIQLIRKGIDLGINYVDTAFNYQIGKNERIVGQALKDGYRERVHLTTKLPMWLINKEEDFDKYLEKQLAKLDVNYIDIYLFHAVNKKGFEKIKKLNLIEKMERAKAQGKIKHFGFSFHDTHPVFKEIIDYHDWEVCQIQYNYMDTEVQAGTLGLEYAHEKGVAAIIMEPLRGGYLANPPQEASNIIKNSLVKRTPVDWALQFLWNHPAVSCVLSGMNTMQQITENCESASKSGVGILNEEEKVTITGLAKIYQDKIVVPCTACQYCMPCPHGVNIPQNFALVNNKNMIGEGSIFNSIITWQISRKYKSLVKNKKHLNKERNNGRATLCENCGVCVSKCPQHINIPQELERVNNIFRRKI